MTFDVADRRPVRINTKGLHEPDRFIADIEERIGYQIPFV